MWHIQCFVWVLLVNFWSFHASLIFAVRWPLFYCSPVSKKAKDDKVGKTKPIWGVLWKRACRLKKAEQREKLRSIKIHEFLSISYSFCKSIVTMEQMYTFQKARLYSKIMKTNASNGTVPSKAAPKSKASTTSTEFSQFAVTWNIPCSQIFHDTLMSSDWSNSLSFVRM